MNEEMLKLKGDVVRAKRKLEEAEIEHQYGLINTADFEAVKREVAEAEVALKKAELEAARTRQDTENEARKQRYAAAAERAKEVRIDAVDMLTDDVALARDLAGNIANAMARQVAYLEGVYTGLRVRASQKVGQQQAYDVRAVTGEGSEDADSLLEQLNRVEAQMRECDALGIAAESKFHSLQDEAVEKGLIPADRTRDCFFRTVGGNNFMGAVEAARRENDRRYIERQKANAAIRDKLRRELPSIDAELAVG